ncbi:MAG: glycosyltransferase [Chitinophagaceae bacterium]
MDLSIIICTYNPDQKVFGKCLNAIRSLRTDGINIEVIIVDNNSSTPLSSLEYVAEFLNEVSCSRLIIERNQGLSHARIAGFHSSSGDKIIFFDDDNEPFSDYVVKAKEILDNRPFVGIMGPGQINVEYIDGVDPWISQHLNKYFQEKNQEREEYVLSIVSWAPCYPPGTGQIIRRFVFESYLEMFLKKKLKTLDRYGESLSSGGDSQMIWSSINLNYAVGHHPDLRLNHLIPKKRANLKYIKRLSYYLDLSGRMAFAEMYPDKSGSLPQFKTSTFLYDLFKVYFNGVKNKQIKSININVWGLIGRNQAYINIAGNTPPFLFKTVKRLLSVS